MNPSASRAASPESMTWVMPAERGLEGRLGRSRQSGSRSSGKGGGMLTAGERRTDAAQGGRQLALDRHRHVGQRAGLPLRPQQAEHVDVVVAVAVAVPVAQHALV